MPEVTATQTRVIMKLSPVDRLKRAIEQEADLIEFHELRRRDAEQRLRDYKRELEKMGGGIGSESPTANAG